MDLENEHQEYNVITKHHLMNAPNIARFAGPRSGSEDLQERGSLESQCGPWWLQFRDFSALNWIWMSHMGCLHILSQLHPDPPHQPTQRDPACRVLWNCPRAAQVTHVAREDVRGPVLHSPRVGRKERAAVWIDSWNRPPTY